MIVKTINGRHYVQADGKVLEFATLREAWAFLFKMKGEAKWKN